jgi:hypothetical protein
MKTSPFCRTFRCSTRLSTAVEEFPGVRRIDNGARVLAAVSATAREAATVENFRPEIVDYTAQSARPGRLFHSRSRRETHLPAERPSAQAAARIPSTDVVARRSRHPQAPPRERTQAPLGLMRTAARSTTRAAAERTPSGVFARRESAPLGLMRTAARSTTRAAAERTPSGVFARRESAPADSRLAH